MTQHPPPVDSIAPITFEQGDEKRELRICSINAGGYPTVQHVAATPADLLAAGFTSNTECARVLNDLQQSHVREISAVRGELERARANRDEWQAKAERLGGQLEAERKGRVHLEERLHWLCDMYRDIKPENERTPTLGEVAAAFRHILITPDQASAPAPEESAPVNPMSPDGDFTIQLSEYHVVNLRELIKCCGVGDGGAEPALFAYNTGDWIGELWWKLEKFGPCKQLKPNRSVDDVRAENSRKSHALDQVEKTAENSESTQETPSIPRAPESAKVAGGEEDFPPFGVDPADSAALLKLRSAIDDADMWPSVPVKESGDYEAAVAFMVSLVRERAANEKSFRRKAHNQRTELNRLERALSGAQRVNQLGAARIVELSGQLRDLTADALAMAESLRFTPEHRRWQPKYETLMQVAERVLRSQPSPIREAKDPACNLPSSVQGADPENWPLKPLDDSATRPRPGGFSKTGDVSVPPTFPGDSFGTAVDPALTDSATCLHPLANPMLDVAMAARSFVVARRKHKSDRIHRRPALVRLGEVNRRADALGDAVDALFDRAKDSDQHRGISDVDKPSPAPRASIEGEATPSSATAPTAGNVTTPHGDTGSAPCVVGPDAGRATYEPCLEFVYDTGTAARACSRPRGHEGAHNSRWAGDGDPLTQEMRDLGTGEAKGVEWSLTCEGNRKIGDVLFMCVLNSNHGGSCQFNCPAEAHHAAIVIPYACPECGYAPALSGGGETTRSATGEAKPAEPCSNRLCSLPAGHEKIDDELCDDKLAKDRCPQCGLGDPSHQKNLQFPHGFMLCIHPWHAQSPGSTVKLALPYDPLHPTGRCSCGGEGRCNWCKAHCVLCGASLLENRKGVCLACEKAAGASQPAQKAAFVVGQDIFCEECQVTHKVADVRETAIVACPKLEGGAARIRTYPKPADPAPPSPVELPGGVVTVGALRVEIVAALREAAKLGHTGSALSLIVANKLDKVGK